MRVYRSKANRRTLMAASVAELVVGLSMVAAPSATVGTQLVGTPVLVVGVWLTYRCARARLTVSSDELVTHGFARTIRIKWIDVTEVTLGEAPSLLPWVAPLIRGRDGRTRRVEEAASLALFRPPSETYAASVVRELQHYLDS
jgi:hypothetical protein